MIYLLENRLDDSDFSDFFAGHYKTLPRDYYCTLGDISVSVVNQGDCYTVKYVGPKSFVSGFCFAPTNLESTYFFGTSDWSVEGVEKLLFFWHWLVYRLLNTLPPAKIFPFCYTVGNPNHLPLEFKWIKFQYKFRVSSRGVSDDSFPEFLNQSHVYYQGKSFADSFLILKDNFKKYSERYGLLA